MSITLKQDVKQFIDEEIFVEQIFKIDDDLIEVSGGEPWVIIEHESQNITMSLENWKALVKMAEMAFNNYQKK